MRIEYDSVVFHDADMHFVKRYGLMKATDTALAYTSEHLTPFIDDIYQLADLLSAPVGQLRQVAADVPSFYRTSQIPKRSGGVRRISEPLYPLCDIQFYILRRILYRLYCSPHARAYYPSATLYRNAQPHVGKRYLLKMDVTDFFGSIRAEAVAASVFAAADYPEYIVSVLTELCCLNGVLPQGAVTSPAISNLVMRRFDDAFGGWCAARGLSYTRWCDDITVSGDTKLYPAYCRAKELLGKYGFSVNEKKTRFLTGASRLTVTGLTVNEKVNIPADYRRRLRQELYYAGRYGVRSAAQRLGYADAGKYYQSLMGRLNFVLSVLPDNDYFTQAKQSLRTQSREAFAQE